MGELGAFGAISSITLETEHDVELTLKAEAMGGVNGYRWLNSEDLRPR